MEQSVKHINRILVAFAVVCGMLLLGGCSYETATWETPAEPETTTEKTTEATTAPTTEAAEEPTYPEYNQSMEDWKVPPNAEEFLYPSQEEMNEIMMEEAQEAMQNYYEYGDGYYDYDTSLGKRGR